MSTSDGRPACRTTFLLALLAIAALGALLLAGPREFTHGVRLFYAAVAAAIALVAALVLASRAARPTDEALDRKHVAWVAAVCVAGLGAAAMAVALPHSPSAPAAAPAADAGPATDAGVPDEAAPVARKREPAGGARDVDEEIARAGAALGRDDFAQAESLFRGAVEKATAAGLDDRRLTASMGLGESLLVSGKTDEAIEVITAARSWAEGAFDAPPPDGVRLMVVEARARALAKDLPAAAALAEQAIALADRHHPGEAQLRGTALATLVDTLLGQGQPDEALAAVDAQLARLRAAPRPDGAEVAAWLDTAGRVLGMAKRYEESAARLKEALDLLRKAGDPDPVRVALTQSSLSFSLWNAGKKAEAKKLLAEARKVLEARLPEDHPARARVTALAAEMGR
ncbi:MAG: tetratricopeptide repeat protein [Proteobacteria bacterium]|jgi:tetratricopeptide (TPR) repeat protein|nr:tetratricopeptide repeat protein [Pseudomonadota bacterium]